MNMLSTEFFTPRSIKASASTWIRDHAVVSYFLLTLGLAWPWMWAEVLGSYGLIPFRLSFSGSGIIFILLVAYTPTLAALITTALIDGKSGVRSLFARLLIWRVGWQWYAVALSLPAVIGFATRWLEAMREEVLAPLPAFSWQLSAMVLVALLVRGIVNGEEIGWRGFALPRLQANMSAFTASLVLGGMWALFHLPIFFVKGSSVLGSQNEMNPLLFLIGILASSILVTWLFNHTRGSLLIAYLYHGAVNTWTSGVFRDTSIEGSVILVVVALLVAFGLDPAKFNRSQT